MNADLRDPAEVSDLDHVVQMLRAARTEILGDWLNRVRENATVVTGDGLSDPLLLDHLPQLFDSMLDRLEVNRPREDAEQWAAIHGFTRRISGYDVVETAIELLMFRRAIWAFVTTADAPVGGAYLAMEQIDGLVDRAVITSLKAYLDPAARMLVRRAPELSVPMLGALADEGAAASASTSVSPAADPLP